MRIRSIVLFVLALFLLAPHTAHAQSPDEVVSISLEDIGYSDLSIKSMYGAASAFIPFQSNWALQQEGMLDVAYVASPLLKEDRSTLTVIANDLELVSVRLVADGNEHHISANIPVERLQGNGVLLRFQGYLRLTEFECEETNNAGQWLTILRTTNLTLTPMLATEPPDLSQLPEAIVVQNAPGDPPPVVFVLPDSPDAVTLTTAAQVAARLGSSSGNWLFPFEVASPATLTQQQRETANLVVVGLPAQNALIGELSSVLPASPGDSGFRTADGFISPPEHGVVQILPSPWNPAGNILQVSAGNSAGLAQAGVAFADHATFDALEGAFTFVRSKEVIAAPVPGQPWLGSTTTFAQLGDRERLVQGTGIFEEWYYFRRPPGWVLDNGSQLTLHLAFSPVLRPTESYVAVFINDVFVGAMRTGRGIEETQVTFDLPTAQLNQMPNGERPQELTLRLEISNQLVENNCEQTHPDAAWTRIFTDSYFTTPHVYLAVPDLQAFPYPFVSDQPGSLVTIVLPDQPEAGEIGMGLSLAATLGRYAPADFGLRLVSASEVSRDTYSDSHLIVIGRRDRQPLIDQFLRQMTPVAGFEGEPGLYRALQTTEAGLLREAPSPWNPDRVVLLVFAQSDGGFKNALNALLGAAPPVDQPGSVAVIQPGQPPRIIYRSVSAGPVAQPGAVLHEPLIPQPEPWMVVTAVLVVATLAVLVILWLARRRAARRGS